MDILVFALLVLLAWLWFGGVQAKEAALRVAQRLCDEHGVALLDQTVTLKRVRLRRDRAGRLRLRRDYLFEYSHDGATRCTGALALLSRRLLGSRMDGACGGPARDLE